ncbi:hypothetical protein [Kordia jejudonensis]|uniref:hypothetical protein n=1 Tax=Kordia jejudonensis TaxID=1348245 RepID=UPI0012E01BA3|nr:hypothetical protein [Kordia jejudonensis]
MKKVIQRKGLTLKKVNIAKIDSKSLANIKGGTRSTASGDGQTNEGEHTCVLF